MKIAHISVHRTVIKEMKKNLNNCDKPSSWRVHKCSVSSLIKVKMSHKIDAFIDKITQYNNSAVGELRNGRFQESLVYLNEAENILECAASCGRNISRSFIISVLQNSACAYLHTWEVDKASIYIEAILFNLVGEGSKDETPVTESEKRIY